jgi:alkylated DNA repair dioxygenase AlkB
MNVNKIVDEINGLSYVKNFLSDFKVKQLIEYIDSKVWDTTLKRRTQHYGHKYVYVNANPKTNPNRLTNTVPPVPKKFLRLFKKIQDVGFASDIPIEKLQVIVNEYTPGQGIAPHIDDCKQFGDWVISVSLGSSLIINFTKDNIKKEIWIEDGSLYEMKLDSRYKWTHSINSVKTDEFDGIKYNRERRISITFRYIK